MMKFKPSFRWVLPLSIVLLAITGGANMLLRQTNIESADVEKIVNIDGDIVYGNPSAPNTVLAFVSLTCPHCRRWEMEEMPVLLNGPVKDGRLRIIIRDFPLDGAALEAASLVRCLPAMRRSQAHEQLMRGVESWAGPFSLDHLAAAADVLKLSGDVATVYKACARSEETKRTIVSEQIDAQHTYSISATPTFVFGHRVVAGETPASEIMREFGQNL